MPQVNTDTLLEGVTPDAPCGADLSYDPAFMELERLAQGGPQERIVGPDVPAEGPDWRVVEQQALALLTRTKDLRVAVLLAKSLLRTGGFKGFRDGIFVVRGLLTRYWDSLHPQLDPEFDFSPIMRGNILRDLCDRVSVLTPVRATPLVSLAGLGSFSLRDIGLATGEITPTNGTPPPEMTNIDAAFGHCPVEQLEETVAAIRDAVESVVAIETFMAEKVGAVQTISLEDLAGVLRQIQHILQGRLAERVPDMNAGSVADTASDGGNGVDMGATGSDREPMTYTPGSGGASASAQSAQGRQPFRVGEIGSRNEVIRALDAVCGYYERHEPSSPVPILLRRAQRLVPMNFVDIMRDLAPSAMSDIEKIRGPEDSEN
jgi:type VI secretion system protein ImpA